MTTDKLQATGPQEDAGRTPRAPITLPPAMHHCSNGLPATNSWDEWHAARVQQALAPHGLAAVLATHWLGAEPVELPGLPGRWSADDYGVRVDGEVELTRVGGEPPQQDADGWTIPFEARVELAGQSLRIRPFVRVGEVGLRVTSPDAPARAALTDLETYPFAQEWVLAGQFEPVRNAHFVTRQTDGTVVARVLAGRIHLWLDGAQHALAATATPDGLFFTFWDPTRDATTSAFRFLETPAPEPDGRVILDFNRAYLPPASFSDAYSCPLPPRANRLPVAVRAGENRQRYRTDGRPTTQNADPG